LTFNLEREELVKTDKPNGKSTGTVPLNTAAVKQKHRMAAGEKCDGQRLPPAPAAERKTPA
jgi:hypothetical protein